MTFSTIEIIVKLVAEANRERDLRHLTRRVLKLIEELGEVSEAYLETTSLRNHKQKTWADVKEESADVLIVAIDIALTVTTVEELVEYIRENLHRYSGSFDSLIRQICYAVAHFDGALKDSLEAFEHIGTAVCFALSLNQLLHCYDDGDSSILAEVNRKLDKWLSGVSTAEPVE